jgi:hypothetical protein
MQALRIPELMPNADCATGNSLFLPVGAFSFMKSSLLPLGAAIGVCKSSIGLFHPERVGADPEAGHA